MNIRLRSQDEILELGTRTKIIQEILEEENQVRKEEHFKRSRVYKDETVQFVLNQLLKQFDFQTVNEMQYAVSNLSVCKKIIDKLARVYNHGVDRDVRDDEAAEEMVEEISKELDINSIMKKTNRWLKLHRNTKVYVKPLPVLQPNGDVKFKLKVEALAPYLYDVIEDFHDRERPMVCILSNFIRRDRDVRGIFDPSHAGRSTTLHDQRKDQGNKKDEKIADTPGDENAENNEFIWWTDKWHFTTNQKGVILGNIEQIENPIGMMPFVNFAIDQDGSYWALGGQDLVDGSILVNSMMSNVNHIAITQGYGQLVITGENVNKSQRIGPNHAIALENPAEGGTAPTASFITANPPIDQLVGLMETYVAMLLTTNNLSVSGIASNLNGGSSAASGISLIIDKAESMEDVQDQAQIFIDNEPWIWRLIAKWLDLLGSQNNLVDDQAQFRLPVDVDVDVKFNAPSPIMSESERLDIIDKRKTLGINTMLELLMKDDPSLTSEQAEKKLLEIQEEKMNRLQSAMFTVGKKEDGDSNEGNGESSEDDSEDRSGAADDKQSDEESDQDEDR